MLFLGVQSEYLDDVNIFILLQMYAATFSSIGKESSQKLLLYLGTRKGMKETKIFSFPFLKHFIFNFFLHFLGKHTLMNYTVVSQPNQPCW